MKETKKSKDDSLLALTSIFSQNLGLQLPVVQLLFLLIQRKLPLFKSYSLSKGSCFADRNSQNIKHSPGSTKAEVPVSMTALAEY